MRFIVKQAKHAKLEELNACYSSRDILSHEVTQAHIIEAMACASPLHADTTAVFCGFVCNVVALGEAAACALFLEAGVIPFLFSCLRFGNNVRVHSAVQSACYALYLLTKSGGPGVLQAVQDEPDFAAALIAARYFEPSLVRTVFLELGLTCLAFSV